MAAQSKLVEAALRRFMEAGKSSEQKTGGGRRRKGGRLVDDGVKNSARLTSAWNEVEALSEKVDVKSEENTMVEDDMTGEYDLMVEDGMGMDLADVLGSNKSQLLHHHPSEQRGLHRGTEATHTKEDKNKLTVTVNFARHHLRRAGRNRI